MPSCGRSFPKYDYVNTWRESTNSFACVHNNPLDRKALDSPLFPKTSSPTMETAMRAVDTIKSFRVNFLLNQTRESADVP
jgi:hypothetical protein